MNAAADEDTAHRAERLAVRADFAGVNSLLPSERIIVRAWSAFGVICNGGFQYFYEGSTEILAVADAFEALGLPDAAQACRESRKCMAQPDATGSDTHLDLLNHIIWELNDDGRLVHALAAYMHQTKQL